MPKKIKINKALTPGRPKTAVNKTNLPEKIINPVTPSLGELPKKIVGSHMGFMQTGGTETPPVAKGPAIANKPKQPPKPRQAPPR